VTPRMRLRMRPTMHRQIITYLLKEHKADTAMSLLRVIDTNADGKVTLAEWQTAWRNGEFGVAERTLSPGREQTSSARPRISLISKHFTNNNLLTASETQSASGGGANNRPYLMTPSETQSASGGGATSGADAGAHEGHGKKHGKHHKEKHHDEQHHGKHHKEKHHDEQHHGKHHKDKHHHGKGKDEPDGARKSRVAPAE